MNEFDSQVNELNEEASKLAQERADLEALADKLEAENALIDYSNVEQATRMTVRYKDLRDRFVDFHRRQHDLSERYAELTTELITHNQRERALLANRLDQLHGN